MRHFNPSLQGGNQRFVDRDRRFGLNDQDNVRPYPLPIRKKREGWMRQGDRQNR
jgi:hypothetical protein